MDDHGSALPLEVIVLLAAAVAAPPIFKRLGLGAIVGYLAAGILIGPSALGIFREPEEILRTAELGVVLLLFVIGLELEFSRLLAMRRDIVGLGLAQLALTSAVIGTGLWIFGLPGSGAIVGGFALALSSTAVAMRLLDDRGHLSRPYGQRTFAVLLAQDLAIVPALALVPALSGAGMEGSLEDAVRAVLAIALFGAILVAGRYVIEPVLRLLALTGAREVMIAGALLLVFGAALGAERVGLSMALGAFLAGLLLAESSYKHELTADVEPFRGLLLALFFMGVGMSLDVPAVIAQAPLLAAGLMALLTVKMSVAGFLARAGGSPRKDALRVATLLAPTSEFAFVLMALASREGLLQASTANLLAALGALSMIAGPPLATLVERLAPRLFPSRAEEMDESFDGARGSALVLGFGRFGQIATQLLVAEGVETTLIDFDADRIRAAARFGTKVYYGDASRIDVLRAARADLARAILICVSDPDLSLRVVEMVKAEFPQATVLARAYDRVHAFALIEKGVDYQIREQYESSLVFGREALRALGTDPERAAEVEADVRRRDAERFEMQRLEGFYAGMDLLHQKTVRPEPLSRPAHPAEALNREAAAAVAEDRVEAGSVGAGS